MHVTLGEEGSCVSMAVLFEFFFRTNIGLERDLPRLLLPTLVLRNLINGGGNFSVRPGLDMDFADNFIFVSLSLSLTFSLLSPILSASSFRKMERERRFQIWVVVLGAFFFSAVFLVWFCFVLFFCAVNLLFYFFGIYLSLHGWMNGLY